MRLKSDSGEEVAMNAIALNGKGGLAANTAVTPSDLGPRHCQRCQILIYRSREEAVAVDQIYWTARRNRMTEASVRSHSSGVRFVPHINGAVDDLCAACAREIAGHYGLVSGRQIDLYSIYFGGEFAADSPEPSKPVRDPEETVKNVKQKKSGSKRAKHSREELVELHRRYVMEQLSLDDVGSLVQVSGSAIRGWFKKMGLPTRIRGGNWEVGDVKRVCEIHSLQPDQVPGRSAFGDSFDDVLRHTGAVEVPEQEENPEPEPALPEAMATNGNSSSVNLDGGLRSQLDLIQELMNLAKERQVALRVRISVELHAEAAL
ncbi:MAG: hypothetical protein KC441_04360 [Anaerolineales bacterium]|nr:hypothetical protein [Anaerolineales bacterium]